MPRKMASVKLGIGFSPVPFGVAKASTTGGIDTKSLCECGGRCGNLTNDDGHFVACKECDKTYANWFDDRLRKGYKLGDDYIPVDPDALPDEPPVETGQVEKVTPVKRVLLQYAVEGNYYLLPEDEYEAQYGALVAVLNEQSWAMLTYLQFRTTTRRYAIVSEGGVLLALQLADKKALPAFDGIDADEAMVGQAKAMLDGLVTDDAELEDVEGHAIKQAIREQVEAQAWVPEEDADADVPTPEA